MLVKPKEILLKWEDIVNSVFILRESCDLAYMAYGDIKELVEHIGRIEEENLELKKSLPLIIKK